jgi:hypothetical protein
MAKPLDSLYSIMQSIEVNVQGNEGAPCYHQMALAASFCLSAQVNLGGGEGVEGVYGSITGSGMHKILDCLHYSCGLSKKSVMVDVGAGLGR